MIGESPGGRAAAPLGLSPVGVLPFSVMPIMQSPPSPLTLIDGREMLYFAGTGYHCLQGHTAVVVAATEAMRIYGLGSATSRGRLGTMPPLLDVEAAAAEFFRMDDSFFLPSGYMSAAAMLSALADRFDRILFDERTHYAVCDAVRSTGLPAAPFDHRDAESLERLLQARVGDRVLIATDGVFPVTGALAPLDVYLGLASKHGNCSVLVDDAHGIGVLGETGRGTIEHFGLWSNEINTQSTADARLLVCGTLSKAIGGFGGIIPGSRAFLELMRANPLFNGASPPPPAMCAASAAGLRFLRAHPDLRRRLIENAATLKSQLFRIGLTFEDSPAPIVWLTLGDAPNMRRIQRALWDRGIVIDHIERYAGAGQAGGLRIAVFSQHTSEMIGRLSEELSRVL